MSVYVGPYLNETLSIIQSSTQPLTKTSSYEERSLVFESVANALDLSRQYIADFNEYFLKVECDQFFVLDNSGSTNVPLSNKTRRADEMKSILKISLLISRYFDPNGIDIYTLNPIEGKLSWKRVQELQEIDSIFSATPSGVTPLKTRLEDVFRDAISSPARYVNVTVLCDGANDDGMEVVEKLLNNERLRPSDKIRVTFIAITDDGIEFLDNIDKKCKNVAVLSTYGVEKTQVQTKNPLARYGVVDYIAMGLLSGLCAKYDNLDEIRLAEHQPTKEGCCTIS